MKKYIDKIKDTFKTKKEKPSKSPEDVRKEALAKEKEEATKAKKPWVAVLDTRVNPDNIRNGFFELDWNNEFIEQLMDAGYKGESQEEIVDAWFKTIASQVLEDEGLDTSRGSGYINTNKIAEDKSEVS